MSIIQFFKNPKGQSLYKGSHTIALSNTLVEGWPALLNANQKARVSKEKPWLLNRTYDAELNLKTSLPEDGHPFADHPLADDSREMPIMALEYVFRSACQNVARMDCKWEPARPPEKYLFGLCTFHHDPTSYIEITLDSGTKLEAMYDYVESDPSAYIIGFEGDEAAIVNVCDQVYRYVKTREASVLECQRSCKEKLIESGKYKRIDRAWRSMTER